MLLAQSRGTYIALLLALVPLLFGPKIKHKLRTIMILAVLFIILYTFFQNILVADIIPRILNYETLGGRTDIWSVAIQMIKDHLLVGVGFGNFSDMFGSYSIVLRGWYANTGSHNVYVEILADLGIIGSSIFILFQLYILGKIIYSSGDSTIKYFLFALFTYLIVGGMTTDLLLDKAYWFGFGLIIAFVLVRNRSTQKLSLSYTKIEVRTS
jgi:O-antigen ligase